VVACTEQLVPGRPSLPFCPALPLQVTYCVCTESPELKVRLRS
jgi:hypothetical protein